MTIRLFGEDDNKLIIVILDVFVVLMAFLWIFFVYFFKI